MSILDYFFKPKAQPQQTGPRAMAGESMSFSSLNDPNLLEFIRGGSTGGSVNPYRALHNMAVLRCVRLISESIGMLPIHLYKEGPAKEKATDHPLYNLLYDQPNDWLTAYEFKSLMQLNALMHGNAYARVIRVGSKVRRLIPLDTHKVTPELTDTWEMVYHYDRDGGERITLPPSDIFHLRDLSMDGVCGLSRVKLAGQAIGLAMNAETAAARMFSNGMMVGGALSHPGQLGTEAQERLKASIEERYSGAGNAHKWMILEEGMTAEKFANTARDSQHIENRDHQIEEIARCFGVPRPLLMMDDTSWGSGIEQLGIFFVQYTLQPWFTAWEQAIARTLMTPAERAQYFAKFNERALMRGTLKDQADFFSKALGAGGHAPWMTPNEIRNLSEMPESSEKEADSLKNPMMNKQTQQGTQNEPSKTA